MMEFLIARLTAPASALVRRPVVKRKERRPDSSGRLQREIAVLGSLKSYFLAFSAFNASVRRDL